MSLTPTKAKALLKEFGRLLHPSQPGPTRFERPRPRLRRRHAAPRPAGRHETLAHRRRQRRTLYLVNRDNMGHFSANPAKDRAVEQLPGALNHVYATPAYFNGTIYYGGFGKPGQQSPNLGDRLKAFTILNGIVVRPRRRRRPSRSLFPVLPQAVSANGTANGVVWTISDTGVTADRSAFDASDLSRLLYDSTATGPSRTRARLYPVLPSPRSPTARSTSACDSVPQRMYGLLGRVRRPVGIL